MNITLEDVVNNITVIYKTDNSVICRSANTSTLILDKRTRIETAVLHEKLINKELPDQMSAHKSLNSWLPYEARKSLF